MVVVKMGNIFFDIDKNVFKNILEMYEITLPLEWHSYCISIDLIMNNMKLYHNDHLQVVQNFTITHTDQEGLAKLMTRGHLGGPKFLGIIADFQVFGTALSEDSILQWTSCQIQVSREFSKLYLHIRKAVNVISGQIFQIKKQEETKISLKIINSGI